MNSKIPVSSVQYLKQIIIIIIAYYISLVETVPV